MRVLVIEDDPTMAMLFGNVLTSGAHEVTVRSSEFESVVDDVDWSQVDVALVDQWLEDVDGKAILARLEAEHPYVRRIMLTADQLVIPAETHAHRVLVKPAPLDVIRRVIDEVS
jgi:DNA-binding response OmpR family regulator